MENNNSNDNEELVWYNEYYTGAHLVPKSYAEQNQKIENAIGKGIKILLITGAIFILGVIAFLIYDFYKI